MVALPLMSKMVLGVSFPIPTLSVLASVNSKLVLVSPSTRKSTFPPGSLITTLDPVIKNIYSLLIDPVRKPINGWPEASPITSCEDWYPNDIPDGSW